MSPKQRPPEGDTLERTEVETTVWTVGHGAGSPDDLERRLRVAGIQMIVDVRAQPAVFRTPDFTKPTLELLAADAGLGYRWLGASLGRVSPESPTGSRATAGDAFVAGIHEIIALAQVARTVVLCSEQAPDLCRRSLVIAPALRERGVPVVHLLGETSWRLHEQPLPLEDPL